VFGTGVGAGVGTDVGGAVGGEVGGEALQTCPVLMLPGLLAEGEVHEKAERVQPVPVSCKEYPTGVIELSLTPTTDGVKPEAGPAVAVTLPS
jgi:hypothetical protein